MKKKHVRNKLSLDKKVISTLSAAFIYGGHNEPSSDNTKNFPNGCGATTDYCNWTIENTRRGLCPQRPPDFY
jgi:hypothetical protein